MPEYFCFRKYKSPCVKENDYIIIHLYNLKKKKLEKVTYLVKKKIQIMNCFIFYI